MHISISATIISVLASASCIQSSPVHTGPNKRKALSTRTWKPTPFANPSPNNLTSSYVLDLTELDTRVNSRTVATLHNPLHPGAAELSSLVEGGGFAASITVGNQTLQFVVDTGSSDLWVIRPEFKCVDPSSRKEIAQAECAFGPAYSVDDNFRQIEGEYLNIKYADGETLSGVIGTNDVILAGITVNQTIGLVDYTGWYGDGVTSGLLGLAYPSIARARSNQSSQASIYKPIFTTIYDQGLIDPVFSIYMTRHRHNTHTTGFLALGGLPPVTVNGHFASTPILITQITGYARTYGFYTIDIEGITVKNRRIKSDDSGAQYIVDSGTTLNYYPNSIADAVNAAFNPPAVYSDDQGAYVVKCDAKPPNHGVTIGGTTFHIDPLDMIRPGGTDHNGDRICISGVNTREAIGEGIYVLGSTFLRNVLAVFDVGAAEMRFASNS